MILRSHYIAITQRERRRERQRETETERETEREREREKCKKMWLSFSRDLQRWPHSQMNNPIPKVCVLCKLPPKSECLIS